MAVRNVNLLLYSFIYNIINILLISKDFYVDDHWSKLPSSWTTFFRHLPPEQMCFLLGEEPLDQEPALNSSQYLWPLSLLSLRTLMKELCISRRQKRELPDLSFSEEQNELVDKYNIFNYN